MKKKNHERIRHLSTAIQAIAAVILFAGCPDYFTTDLNSPMDPDADGYLGYTTVDDADALEPLLIDGATLDFMVFPVNEVLGADAYRLQISTAADFDTMANVVFEKDDFTTRTMATGADLTAGALYYWRGTARLSGSWGTWTEPRSFTMNELIAGMSPLDTTDTTPLLTWEVVAGADHYEVQIADSALAFESATAVETSTNSYTPSTGLTNNAAHYWRVRAITTDGKASGWSTTSSLTVGWGAITGMRPDDGESTTDTTPPLSWDTVDGADHYEVQIADSEGGVESATVVSVATNSYTPSPFLANNETHYWRVRAVDGAGQSTAWSSKNSLNISWGAISGMDPFSGETIDEFTPTLRWTAVSNADHYEVQRATTFAGVAGASIENAAGNSFTVPSAIANTTTYYWRVRAIDGDIQSGTWSSIASFYVNVAPTVTTTTISNIGSTTATSGGSITDNGATILSKGVCWSTSSNPTTSGSKTTDGSGSNSYTSSMTGLSSGTNYYVRAYVTYSGGTVYGDTLTFQTIYSIGSTGPAGGIVFYDKGAYSSGWRYLEAAPVDQSTSGVRWGWDTGSTGAHYTEIGTGDTNTNAIVAAYSGYSTSYAAKLCYNYTNNGYSDWYLPSRDELVLMKENIPSMYLSAATDPHDYWSSSEEYKWFYDEVHDLLYQAYDDAYAVNFNAGGYFGNDTRTYEYRVRAIRKF